MKYYQTITRALKLEEPRGAFLKSEPDITIWRDLVLKSAIARNGLKKTFFEQLKQSFNLTNSQFKILFSITWKSIQGHTKQDLIFGPATDRAVALMELWDEGLDYFDDQEKFIYWLNKKNAIFSDNMPMSILDNPAGVEMIRRKIGQLKHGITA